MRSTIWIFGIGCVSDTDVEAGLDDNLTLKEADHD